MRVKFVAVLACALLAECEWPTVLCGCEPAPTIEVTVRGTVTSASGEPISGAVISASVGTALCARMSLPYTFSPFTNRVAATDGSFNITGKLPPDGCLRLIARHPTKADSLVKDVDLVGRSVNQVVALQFP